MPYDERPVGAEVREGRLWVTLADGRVIAAPLAWYPILHRATPDQQARVELSGGGMHWPEIDEDISVRGMLRGCDGFTSSLDAVLTVTEVAETYGLSPFTIHDAIRHDLLPARKSGGTYLIRRRDAEARWGNRKPGS
jgi:hypothetical protein